MHRSLQAKIATGFGLSIISLVAISIASYHHMADYIRVTSMVGHNYHVIDKLEAIRSLLDKVESTYHDYILTGQERYLLPYSEANSKIDELLRETRELILDGPSPLKKLDSFESLLAVTRERIQTGLDLRQTHGVEAAHDFLVASGGSDILTGVCTLAEELEREARDQLAEQEQEHAAYASSLIPLVTVGSALAIVLVVASFVVISRDLKERRRALAALSESEERYRTLAETAQDFIFIVDLDGIVQYVNGHAARQLGSSPNAIVGSPVREVAGLDPLTSGLAGLRRVAERKTSALLENKVQLPCGEVYLQTSLAALENGADQVVGVLGISRDVTEMAKMRDELRDLALVDELTGIYNRRGFLTLAPQQVSLAGRLGKECCVLLADLDGLKAINDRHGHADGDRALRTVAAIFRSTCRQSDVVARLGGDEFAVLSVDTSIEGGEALVRRIDEACKESNLSGQYPYTVSVSIGVAPIPSNSAKSVEAALREADGRMYERKRQGVQSR